MSLLSIYIFIFFIAILTLRKVDILRPDLFLLLRWSISIIIFEVTRKVFLDPIGLKAEMLLLSMPVVFFIGSTFSHYVFFKYHSAAYVNSSQKRQFNLKSLKKLVIILLSPTVFFFFQYLIAYKSISDAQVGEISGRLAVRLMLSEETLPGFHYFYGAELLGILSFIVLYETIYSHRQNLSPKKIKSILFGNLAPYILILAAAFFMLYFTTSKTNISKLIIWIIFYVLLRADSLRSRPIKSLLLVSVPIILIAALALLTLSTLDANQGLSVISPNDILSLLTPYVSSPFIVFDKIINDNSVVAPGFLETITMSPITKVLAALGLVDSGSVASHIGRFYFTPLPSNIGTFLDVPYKDFGLLGLVIVPFFLGLISMSIYKFYRTSQNPAAVLAYTVILLGIFSSPTAGNYFKPSYIFQVFIIVLVVFQNGGLRSCRR
jgi:oligosaccharide repeat unit polymerase